MSLLKLFAQQVTQTVVEFFLPPKCVECGCAGSFFCAECQATLTIPPPVSEPDSALVECRSTAEFSGPIQKAIHEFKYENLRALARPLAERLAAALERATAAGWAPTLITAIPLHESRLRERGYNQSALLARWLAERSGLPFRAGAVHRIRATRQQVGLNSAERRENVAGAFAADPEIVREQQVVLVDDVHTTGTTLHECAVALHQAGAARVWGLTVAKAVYKSD